MHELTAARLRKAEKALASSRTPFAHDDAEGACNRAYYAMFYAAHAALENVGVIPFGTIYKTHHGLIATFNEHFVLSGRFEHGLGRALSKVHDLRLLADYRGDPPVSARVEWAIDQAAVFVAEIRAMIERQSTT